MFEEIEDNAKNKLAEIQKRFNINEEEKQLKEFRKMTEENDKLLEQFKNHLTEITNDDGFEEKQRKEVLIQDAKCYLLEKKFTIKDLRDECDGLEQELFEKEDQVRANIDLNENEEKEDTAYQLNQQSTEL